MTRDSATERRANIARLELRERALAEELRELEHHARRAADRRIRGENSAELEREEQRLASACRANRRDHARIRRKLERLREESDTGN